MLHGGADATHFLLLVELADLLHQLLASPDEGIGE